MAGIQVPLVNCLVLLNEDGGRILGKYYDGRAKEDQVKSEAGYFKKTKSYKSGGESEVFLLESEVVVFRNGSDCKFYISSSSDENELILCGVMDAVYETLYSLLQGQMDERTLVDNLELVLLTIDEVIDHGQIMELDPTSVQARVLMMGGDITRNGTGEQAIGDLSVSQALNIAKEQFKGFLNNPRDGGF